MTWTVLHDACESQDFVAVRNRVNSNEANKVDDRGETPLHVACWGDPPVDALEALVKAYPQSTTDRDRHGDTPLHVAVSHPNANDTVVKFLLGVAAPVASMTNQEGLTPLHKACRHCPVNEKVIEALLEVNPYAVRTRSKMGNPAPTRQRKESPTLHAVVDGEQRAGPSSLDLRFHALDTQVRDGSYPLHSAVQGGTTARVVDMLLNVAPEVIVFENKFGETPLHVALSHVSEDENGAVVVDLLLQADKDDWAVRRTEKRNGNLPLHMAAQHGWSFAIVIELLVRYPEAILSKNIHSKTPLEVAVESGKCSQEVLDMMRSLDS